MNNTPSSARRFYGFRFSVTDAVVLAIAAAATAWLRFRQIPVWWMVPLVVGHFFLFCNLFRVRRNYELLWGFILIINSATWMISLNFDGIPVLLTQTPVTLLLVCMELRSPDYHGILAARFNSRLPDYLARRLASPQRGGQQCQGEEAT